MTKIQPELPLYPENESGEESTLVETHGSPSPPLTREQASDAINDLFRRAMKSENSRAWMKGLLTLIAGMRRYSIFNAKLIYVQRPGAVAVGTPRYWSRKRRSIRPGAMPIVIIVPKGPFTLVYEYEDTEGPEPRTEDKLFAASGRVTSTDWDRLKGAVERDGKSGKRGPGYFKIVEEGLGYGRGGDVHFKQDARGRFVIRINRNLDPAAKWSVLVHELGHVYCGHCGVHDRGWWLDRRTLSGIGADSQHDIREFEAEAVAWIVTSRAGIQTKSADYLADKVAPLDNERIDIDAVLRSANHIESLAPAATLKAFRADDEI